MYKILKNEKLNENTYLMEVEAGLVIKNAMPGQFVIVMTKESSERIPLTIYDMDKEKGILSLIYQVVGASTLEMSHEKKELYAVLGPIGKPNIICENYEEYRDKKIVYIAGGVGVAPIYPQMKYLKERGINVDLIYGARSKDVLIIRDKIDGLAYRTTYCTNDGSYGIQGYVTNALEAVINNYDICVCIGPMAMMKSVCDLTKKYHLKTIVSLNPIMVDGSGMCGACRCEIEGKPKFACIDGPEFDGHKVNFDALVKRGNIYKDIEKEKYDLMREKYE